MSQVLLRKLKVLIVPLFLGALLLLLLEATLAFFFSDHARYENPFAQPAFGFDAQTIVRLRPEVERRFIRSDHNGGERITWRVNSAGYRGSELREDGTPRIVVYGDSSVQARFSQLDDTYPKQLEQKLEEHRGQAVEVVNAGVVGFGPDQSVLRMTRELPALKADLVILHIFADNDYGDLVRNRLFDLSPDNALIRTAFVLELDEWLAGDRSRRISRFARSLLTVRMITRLLPAPGPGVEVDPVKAKSEFVRDELARRESEYAIYASRSPRTVSHFADSYDIDVALYPTSAAAKTKFHLMHGVLLRAKQVAEANGGRLMVLIQPSVVDLTDVNAPVGKSFLTRYPDYSPQTLSTSVARFCNAAGIDVLNLYDEFAANNPDLLYFSGSDTHWNDAGQALAADATVRFLDQLDDLF